MAVVLVKGVFDITCYVFKAISRVILRDLTNYYWYYEEANQQDDAAVEGLVTNLNDESYNSLGSTQENERPEIVNDSEHEGGNISYESFCISLNIEDQTTDDLNEIHSIKDNNTEVHNYEVDLNTLKFPQQDLSDYKQNDLNEIQKTEERAVVHNNEDNLNSCESSKKELLQNKLEHLYGNRNTEDSNEVYRKKHVLPNDNPPKNESQNHIPDEVDEIEGVDVNSLVWNDEENLKLLKSFKKQNSIWMEIENVSQNVDLRNVSQNEPNISSQILPENCLENFEEDWELISNTQTENTDLGKDLEEIQNTLIHGHNEINSELSLEVSIERENKPTLESDGRSEQTFIGDRKISKVVLQNDEKSNISSECELGIQNFPTKSLKVECPIVKERRDPKDKKKVLKKKCTTPRKIKQTEKLKPVDKTVTNKPNNTPKEIENIHLLPLTSYEITVTPPLLSESQELTASENSDAFNKLCEFQDDLSEMSKVPEEISDIGSVCSEDSWSSWLSRFASIVQQKSPVRKPDVSLPGPSVAAKDDESKEDLCDCVNSHSCLQVVDSDDELTTDLITFEQLGSVETGSPYQKHN